MWLAIAVDGIQLYHNGTAAVIFGLRPIDRDARDPETGEIIKKVSHFVLKNLYSVQMLFYSVVATFDSFVFLRSGIARSTARS